MNAAGLNPRQEADAVTPAAWRTALDLNLPAPFFLAQAMVPAMRAKGWAKCTTANQALLDTAATQGAVARRNRP